MHTRELIDLKVFGSAGGLVIHVARGRGFALRHYLRHRGIDARLVPAPGTPYERVEVPADVGCERLQAHVDGWPA